VSIILAAAAELFQERLCQRLLDAGCEAPIAITSPAALDEFLHECEENTLVLTGGDWPAPRPFLRVAVRAAAPIIVLLNAATRRVEQMALAEGAQAALDADVPAISLTAALAAVRVGLIVLDQPVRPISRALDPDSLDADAAPFGTARRPARPLTAREQEILSLVRKLSPKPSGAAIFRCKRSASRPKSRTPPGACCSPLGRNAIRGLK
jgi:hypothetical protein